MKSRSANPFLSMLLLLSLLVVAKREFSIGLLLCGRNQHMATPFQTRMEYDDDKERTEDSQPLGGDILASLYNFQIALQSELHPCCLAPFSDRDEKSVGGALSTTDPLQHETWLSIPCPSRSLHIEDAMGEDQRFSGVLIGWVGRT
jgi:hypothetical protein